MQPSLRQTISDLPRYIALSLLVAQLGLVTGCHQPGSSLNRFSDDILVRVHDYQDRRMTDSLYLILTNDDVRYRAEAARAFASVQDTVASERLGTLLLNDRESIVRTGAAYALGQTGGTKATAILLRALAQEKDSVVLNVILEAIGKTAGADEVPNPGFRSAGIPWMYYRFGLRHETPPYINQQVAGYLAPANPPMSRLGAAHFFARAKTTAIDDAGEALVAALRGDNDPEVRMAAAWALRKIAAEHSGEALAFAALHDRDYRVRVNALAALGSFPFDRTRATLFPALNDSILQVRVAAAGAIGNVADERNANEILEAARRASHWRVRAMLLQAANLSGDRGVNARIVALYKASPNAYEKAALLMALSGADALDFVAGELFTTGNAAIRTAAAQVIVALNGDLPQTPGNRLKFLGLYARGISMGDLAVTGLFTQALTDTTLGFREVVTNPSFLYEARDRFVLPRDYESFVPLENAIAFFEDREPQTVNKPFNHPIDWGLAGRIPADQQAIVTTTKGEVVIDLHVDEAPGSVANFVRLVADGYYDRKAFHRVVSNFVVQGGCDRGDGWGSANYSIRSELSGRRYATGSVGLASAGKDTESTQWFITHSPTPHLDGRYTIFGTVSKGMENVHRLEVGDTILSVRLSPAINPG